MLGLTLLRMERKPEGIAALDKAIALDPTRAEAHMALAKVYALDHKLDLAIKHAEIATRREPARGYEMLAQLLMDERRPDEAALFARKSVAEDPRRVMSRFVLGVVAQRAGRYEEAVKEFRTAEDAQRLEKQSVILNLHANLGDCLARLGREAEAEAEFKKELETIPWSAQGRVGLAMLYRSQGHDAQARAVLEGLIAASAQPGPETYWTVVHTLSVLGDTSAAREWAGKARQRFPSDARFR
jgi:tetratricopeptide (TPR) repeat protein